MVPTSQYLMIFKRILKKTVKFFYDVTAGPFMVITVDGVTLVKPIIQNWWRQGMMGGAKAHYDSIKRSSQTDLQMI